MRKCVILKCSSYEIKVISVHKHIHDVQARVVFINWCNISHYMSWTSGAVWELRLHQWAKRSVHQCHHQPVFILHFISYKTNFNNRDITYRKLKIFHICNRQSRYVFKKYNLNDLKKLYDTACNHGYVFPQCQSTCSSFNRPESGLFQANGR